MESDSVGLSNVTTGIGLIWTNKTDNSSSACVIKYIFAETSVSFFVAFILNCMSVAILVRVSRHYPSRILRLMILLALNDVITCGAFLIATAINTFTCDMFQHNLFCKLLGMVGFVAFVTSLNIVALMSVERFMQVQFPFFFLTKWSKVTLISIAVIGLIVDIIFAILPIVGVGNPYLYYNHNRFCALSLSGKGDFFQKMVLVAVGVINELRIITIVICNVSVSITAKRRSKRSVGCWNSTHERATANTRAFVRLTQVIAVVNVILTTPFAIVVTVDVITSNGNLDKVENTIASILMFSTPLVNPFLYVASNKYCRQSLVDMLLCRSVNMRKSTEQDSQRKSSTSQSQRGHRVDSLECSKQSENTTT